MIRPSGTFRGKLSQVDSWPAGEESNRPTAHRNPFDWSVLTRCSHLRWSGPWIQRFGAQYFWARAVRDLLLLKRFCRLRARIHNTVEKEFFRVRSQHSGKLASRPYPQRCRSGGKKSGYPGPARVGSLLNKNSLLAENLGRERWHFRNRPRVSASGQFWSVFTAGNPDTGLEDLCKGFLR